MEWGWINVAVPFVLIGSLVALLVARMIRVGTAAEEGLQGNLQTLRHEMANWDPPTMTPEEMDWVRQIYEEAEIGMGE